MSIFNGTEASAADTAHFPCSPLPPQARKELYVSLGADCKGKALKHQISATIQGRGFVCVTPLPQTESS